MRICQHKGDIFNLLLNGTCDSVIIWVDYKSSMMNLCWQQFYQRCPDLQNKEPFLFTPWRTHHSVPLQFNINYKSKYIYFLTNGRASKCLSDSDLRNLLEDALGKLMDVGCSSVGFNGVLPDTFIPLLPMETDEIYNQKKVHNNTVIRERVTFISDLLSLYCTKQSYDIDVHLISMSNVFIEQPDRILYQQ